MTRKNLKPTKQMEAYEKELQFGRGRKCEPHFTIEDVASGLAVYWKHCGKFMDAEHMRRLDLMQKWYWENDVLPFADRSGKNGI